MTLSFLGLMIQIACFFNKTSGLNVTSVDVNPIHAKRHGIATTNNHSYTVLVLTVFIAAKLRLGKPRVFHEDKPITQQKNLMLYFAIISASIAISSALIGFSLPDQFHKMAYLESGYSRP
jgi:alpha-D-ribose 1-methylphosphonate 5-phosphate C-P lyase